MLRLADSGVRGASACDSQMWVRHYIGGRPHSALGPGVPDPRENEVIPKPEARHRVAADALVIAKSVLGGLRHALNRAGTYSSISDVLADPLHGGATVRAGRVRRVDHRLPRQMRGQRLADRFACRCNDGDFGLRGCRIVVELAVAPTRMSEKASSLSQPTVSGPLVQ